MPESYGKRQRSRVKARKATEREERRIARNQRRAERQGGSVDDDAQEASVGDAERDGIGEAGAGDETDARDTGAGEETTQD